MHKYLHTFKFLVNNSEVLYLHDVFQPFLFCFLGRPLGMCLVFGTLPGHPNVGKNLQFNFNVQASNSQLVASFCIILIWTFAGPVVLENPSFAGQDPSFAPRLSAVASELQRLAPAQSEKKRGEEGGNLLTPRRFWRLVMLVFIIPMIGIDWNSGLLHSTVAHSKTRKIDEDCGLLHSTIAQVYGKYILEVIYQLSQQTGNETRLPGKSRNWMEVSRKF